MKSAIAFLALSITTIVVAVQAPGGDPKPAWPQFNGPFGNYVPRRYGHKLVDDLRKARLAWVSEDKDTGFAKGSVSGYVRHLATFDTHPGSTSGLIVAEGKVFVSTYRPTGEVWAEKAIMLTRALKSGKYNAEAVKRNAAILADDLLIAYDLKTGKVLWKAEEKGKGINRYSGKRNHFGVTPAYYSGRIFSMGTTGRLYCHEAATGKKLWEDATSRLAREMPPVVEGLLNKRDRLIGGGGMSASLVVADGVVVVPQFSAGGTTNIALRGVDPETGKSLWEVPGATCKYATPAVWRHEGREYVLAATVGRPGVRKSAAMRLIDPKSGKVLWTVGGLEPMWLALAPSERIVLVNVGSSQTNPGRAKHNEVYGLLAAYRLSPQGAQRAWTMPDEQSFWFENHFDSCARRRMAIRDGLVYYYARGKSEDGKRFGYVCILREEDGKPLYVSKSEEFRLGLFYLVEDRILNIPDPAHNDRATLELLAATPPVRRLCEQWKPPVKVATAYEVSMETPYVDGFFLLRTTTGQVACYDLRAGK